MSYTVKKKWIYGVIFLVSLVVYLLKITMLNKSGNSPADAGEWTLAVLLGAAYSTVIAALLGSFLIWAATKRDNDRRKVREERKNT